MKTSRYFLAIVMSSMLLFTSNAAYSISPKLLFHSNMDSAQGTGSKDVHGGQFVAGVRGKAFQSISDDQYIYVQSRNIFCPASGTFECWIKFLENTPERSGVVLGDFTDDSGVGIMISIVDHDPKSGLISLRLRAVSENKDIPQMERAGWAKIEQQKWHHYAVTWDRFDGSGPAEMRFYCDGMEIGRNVGGRIKLSGSVDRFTAFRSKTALPGNRARFAVDEMQIWDRATLPGPHIEKTIMRLSGAKKMPDQEWLHNKIGISDKVPAPWIPVKSTGYTVNVWGREYQFSKGSAFPELITAAGAQVLSGPVNLRILSEGKSVILNDGTTRFSKRQGTSAVFRSTRESAAFTLTSRTTIEYDGMLKAELTLSPKKPVRLDTLSLDIPLKAEHAKYLNVPAASLSDYSPAWEGLIQTFSGFVPEKGWTAKFFPFIWLGDEDRGLCWFTESDQYWRTADKNRAVQIIRRGSETLLRLHLRDMPFTLDKDLHFTFGLQATPVKPLPKNWRTWRTTDAVLGFREDGKSNLTPDVPNAENGRMLGLMWTHAGEWKYFGFPEPKDKAAFESLTKKTGTAKRLGINTLPYWQTTMCSEGIPEWKTQKYQWTCYSAVDNLSGDVLSMGYPINAVCSNSSWSDFIIYKLIKGFEELGETGWYQDGYVVSGCRNTAHGCGYIDETGRLKETFPIFARREMMKRLYVAIKERKPDAVIVGHISHILEIPVLSFADAYLDGEAAPTPYIAVRGKTAPPWDGYYIKRLPPDVLQAQYRGAQFGIVQIFLPEIFLKDTTQESITAYLDQTEHMCALMFAHDIHNFWAFRSDQLTVYKYYKVMDDFGLVDSQCMPYWSNSDLISCSNPDVKVTAYCRPGKVLLVISNLSEADAEPSITVDTAKLGLKSSVRDAPTAVPISSTAGAITIPVKAKMMRMLVWE